ncbi:MAG: glycosyltransferase family 39 protein [Erysipelotrichia bacterium]|nr:glycosyltransferase family 39 protein [Erysipelotrichia bacterium]
MNTSIPLLIRDLGLDEKSSPQDKKKILGLSPWLFEVIISIIAFCFIFFSYILIKPLNYENWTQDGTYAKLYGFVMLAILAIVFVVMFVKGQLDFKRLVIFIFLAGFIMRLTYMLYTHADQRQYDTWTDVRDGHYDYALSFYLTGRLPTHAITPNTVYQFYHPPLNAFLQGIFMHIFEAINWVPKLKYSPEALFGATQILTCFYMYITALFFGKTILLTKFSNGSKLLALSVVVLFPRLVQLSGQLNNDAISVMFSAIALYYFFRWYIEEKKWIYNILVALFVGLALLSKLSAITICLGMAIGYLIQLIRSIRRQENSLPLKQLLLQYTVFILIAAPIGLWWQVFTHYVYGLPYNFVFHNLNSALFTGPRSYVIKQKPDILDYYDEQNHGLIYTSDFYNIFARFILPLWPADLATKAFCSSFDDYNLLSYALRSAVFGEFSYWFSDAQALSYLCVIGVYVAYFSVVISVIYFALKPKNLGSDGWIALAILLGMATTFFYLQTKMPYGCSMDFRYIVPSVLPVAYLVAKTNDLYKEKIATGNKSRFVKTMKFVQVLALVFFIGTSFVFYGIAI